MAKALIVVDVQNDFCEGGSLAVTGGAAAARAISRFVQLCSDYDLIVATRDAHIDPGPHFSHQPDFVDSWPPHCVVGTSGAEFHPDLEITPTDVFDKGAYTAAYSGFEGKDDAGTPLAIYLAAHDVSAVDVVGIATDYCVRATALDAARAGLKTRVITDLVAAVDPSNVSAVLDELAAAGVGQVTSAELLS